ncbi:MAG: FHA domain-containing protein [Methylacidiphilales bacterium]|nr:FHA domain-containing protein [Candidatus Methylacidiphilales bacterium]NJR15403.1 FHA domain-containing protein [Calothrix sp. CSU_2_0]
MIVCPNCNHPNPDGAVQCEACYTPLPATIGCPSCGATVQADASFCGQCGFNLRTAAATVAPTVAAPTIAPTVAPDIPLEVPPLASPEPLIQAQPIVVTAPPTVAPEVSPLPPTAFAVPEPQPVVVAETSPPPTAVPAPMTTSPPITPPPPTIASEPVPAVVEAEPEPEPVAAVVEPEPEPVATVVEVEAEPEPVAVVAEAPAASIPIHTPTQIQSVIGRLIHVQSEQNIELPQNLPVIHIGKPNDRIPPDIDVSGFPNSEVVSRIHADIRVEGDAYYIEDAGSSNGTYINNLPLLPGNRHRLRPGDRVGLGKGDLVTFLFQFV